MAYLANCIQRTDRMGNGWTDHNKRPSIAGSAVHIVAVPNMLQRTHLGDDGSLATAGLAMEDDRARRQVTMVGGALQADADGVEGSVTAAYSLPTSATHRQMLVNLDHLRVESHVLESRCSVVNQHFHLNTYPQLPVLTTILDTYLRSLRYTTQHRTILAIFPQPPDNHHSADIIINSSNATKLIYYNSFVHRDTSDIVCWGGERRRVSINRSTNATVQCPNLVTSVGCSSLPC